MQVVIHEFSTHVVHTLTFMYYLLAELLEIERGGMSQGTSLYAPGGEIPIP